MIVCPRPEVFRGFMKRALFVVASLLILADAAPNDGVVANLNRLSAHARFGTTPFSDLSFDEWVTMRRSGSAVVEPTGKPVLGAPTPKTFDNSTIAAALAQPCDWQTGENRLGLQAVTRNKNQAACGACWDFATVAALESQQVIAGNPLSAFSEQYVLDCLQGQGRGNLKGCAGGDPYTAATLLTQNALPLERMYEFTSYDQSTHACSNQGTLIGQAREVLLPQVSSGQDIENVMAAFIDRVGPLVVSVYTAIPAWQHYTGGVLDVCPPTTKAMVDHAVAIVGYGIDGNVPYWKVKNSWSPLWGENGYVRLLRGTNACGVSFFPLGLQ